MSFNMFSLDPRILRAIQEQGFHQPTPIQQKALPRVLEGCDLIGIAQTGTGKTAAFALPILQRLLSRQPGLIRALVLAPTRELAEQTSAAFRAFGHHTGLKSAALYGGVGIQRQKTKLKSGLDIVIACPGRLLDLMNQKLIDLNALEVLVLDEADRMLDMGFLPDVRLILSRLPRDRQTMLFSATIPSGVRALAREFLSRPVTVQVGLSVPVETVEHAFYPVQSHLKTHLLIELLKKTDTESVLVFVRTKHRAKRLGEQLKKAGFLAASLQGNLPQSKRNAALESFRDGSNQILVATDIAARGLDITSISHVINYDVPDTADSYIHRIGRTGRARKTGDAFTFVAPEDGAIVSAIERMLGERVTCRRIEGFDYAQPAPALSDHCGRLLLASSRSGSRRRGPFSEPSWSRKVKRGLPPSTRRRLAISRR